MCVPRWASPSSCARVHYYIYEGVGGEDAPRVFACFPKQVVLLFNSTCFPWQNKLFSSAKQVVFLGEITCFDIRARNPVSSIVKDIIGPLASWPHGVQCLDMRKAANPVMEFAAFMCCGGRTRTCDLQVMSLASYQLLHSAICHSTRFRIASAKVQLFSDMTKYLRGKMRCLIDFNTFCLCI